jgi:hypothetical protein
MLQEPSVQIPVQPTQPLAQQNFPFVAQQPSRCPVAPDCDLDFLFNSSDQQSSDEQPAETPAQKQERAWQEQAQKTSCHYENPQMAPNGCLMGCGTLVCDGPVRFLEIVVGQGSAVATWVPPLSAALGQTYIVELSYDGNTWRNLSLEQPWATFARFQVDQGKPFQLRVTANGYPSAVKKFDPALSTQANVQIETASVEASAEIETNSSDV